MSRVYAFQNTVEEVMRSSSGGAFIAICKAFEEMHGAGNVVFYGATYGDNMQVEHRGVFSAQECSIFQGSKYVKSKCKMDDLGIADELNQGKAILFSGTPCQVHAFNIYIKKYEPFEEKILTIDIICHGTPKVEFWNAYKEWLEKKNKSKMVAYSFRYKPQGWKAYPAYAEFENGKVLVNAAETSVFSKMHMARYSINKGCFSCPFSKEERVSDITLGDFWGIEKLLPKMNYKTGVSLVLSHSDDADSLIEHLAQNEEYFCRETKRRDYIKYQHNLNKPTEKPVNYEQFWSDFSTISFEKILQKYVGYGLKYRVFFCIKKVIRKTPLIEWYRNRKTK